MASIDNHFSRHWRHYFLLALVMGSFGLLLLHAPIIQDPAYHRFVDGRNLFGIPNFYNVISNFPFLLVGAGGIYVCLRQGPGPARLAWLCFFIGVALVSLGSAFYHLAPENPTLVWDRLPMSMGFMALFAAMLGEHVNPVFSKTWLLPMMLTGASSVLVWHYSGDLRFYAWIQFMPLLVIPALLFLFPTRYTHSYFIMLGLLCYVCAKIFEACDASIFTLLGNEMAGHAIKHLFAAAGGFAILQMLKIRELKPEISLPDV